MKKIKIINGPNLNLLGKREPLLYGADDFSAVFDALAETFPGCNLSYAQSNAESEMVDLLQRCLTDGTDGVVLNPGAYTHTSVAVSDAVRAIGIPVVEVHISNVASREAFRQRSLISPYARGTISGFGTDGYRLAVDFLSRN